MLTPDGPKVLEYNVRFGDPETESLVMLLSDESDLAEIILVRYHVSNQLHLPILMPALRPLWNTVWIRSKFPLATDLRFPLY